MPPSRCCGGRLLGGAFVLATATAWIAASFLAQHLVRPDASGGQPSLHPLLLVWICTALFSLYLPLLAAKAWVCGSTSRLQLVVPEPGSDSSVQLSSSRVLLQNVTTVLPVAAVWFAAQCTFTLALALTSVTSNTILSSSSSMFTLLASALVLGERVTASKLLSVGAVIAGTACVALSDASADDGSRSLAGDALTVAAAALYSVYTVAMQRQLAHDDADAPARFFGYVGLLTLAVGLPVLGALHAGGAIDLLSLQPQALAGALLNGLMDYVVADYTWARAVLLLGPTVATLGMSVQIPMATLADLLLGHPHWLDSHTSVAMTAAGTAAILGGVAGINLAGGGSRADRGSGGRGGAEAAGEGGVSRGGGDDELRQPLLRRRDDDPPPLQQEEV